MEPFDFGALWVAGIIVVLLIFSAFLSGSETALTATSKARILRLQRDNQRRARWVMFLLEEKERLLGAILLANNAVNILASVLATGVFLRLFGEAGLIYATLVMTALVVIFAEVLPKTYAILTPDQTALRASGLLRILVVLLAPFTRLLSFISRSILRLAGFTDENAGLLLGAHEEIRGAIDLHHHEGSVHKGDRDMLGGILDLGDTRLDEIMIHRKSMQMIDANLPSQDIVKIMLDSPFTRIPLWRDEPENIIGMLHAKDLLRALATSPTGALDLEISQLVSPPWFVPETTLLSEQLNAFRTRKLHFALVVDEYGALMGMVTMEDILEEIVGEIDDEHDVPTSELHKRGDGSLEIAGTMSIRDLNREMGWELPDTEASSIAGLIIHEARSIPEVGQVFEFHGLRFRIMSKQRNQIIQIRITSQRA
ncbi:HlyC/CorC family transporter [Alphaproteobacteria bacterium]|nr:HlyC/CorC family transporter [Alphaproteobacteria bacterium]